MHTVQIAIIGAGAAGLTAAIFAGQTQPKGTRIALLEAAAQPGAKILASGGGRCNVTHQRVTPADYNGSSPNAIKKVLAAFTVEQTLAFFNEIGVPLKLEASGKYFPVSNRARSVLTALLNTAERAGVHLHTQSRVQSITHDNTGFHIVSSSAIFHARAVILATGGRSLPKTGSDGSGYALAQALGHSLTPHIFPALVPLLLPETHFITHLSGLSTPVRLTLRTPNGKVHYTTENPLLCTHFGISGPAALDASRHWQASQQNNTNATLHVNFLPQHTAQTLENTLLNSRAPNLLNLLTPSLPDRLARALCLHAHIEPTTAPHQLTRPTRKALIAALTDLPLPIIGTRGFNYAEVTAGGVPLSELHLNSLQSRLCPGLYLCGEICDVDGRIGGFNFQWAWSSGYLAGTSVGVEK
ncbi:MAG: NAD(P)/FAD-dependent oxidoreductase [Anaerolineales bacterium]